MKTGKVLFAEVSDWAVKDLYLGRGKAVALYLVSIIFI